jgi:hypothetical protein
VLKSRASSNNSTRIESKKIRTIVNTKMQIISDVCCALRKKINLDGISKFYDYIIERFYYTLPIQYFSPNFISTLHIADKPICRSEQKRIYGVARNEAAEILCEVDAYPPPDSFKWSFNNTAETFEMPQSDYRIHSSRASSLSYTPVKVRLL